MHLKVLEFNKQFYNLYNNPVKPLRTNFTDIIQSCCDNFKIKLNIYKLLWYFS